MLQGWVGFRVDETASGGDAGLGSLPCVMVEPGLGLWLDGTAVVCVGAALHGFCGAFCAAPSAVNCAEVCSQRLLCTKATAKPVDIMGLAETLRLL